MPLKLAITSLTNWLWCGRRLKMFRSRTPHAMSVRVVSEPKLKYVTPAYSRRQLVILPCRDAHERNLALDTHVDAFNSTLDFRGGRAAVQKLLRPTVGSHILHGN